MFLIFYTSFPCNFPSCKVFFLSSLFLFVNSSFVSPYSIRLSFSAPLSISSLLSLRLSYNPLLSVVMQSSALMSPLPHSFRFIYNLATLFLGCKHLFNVIIFLVFKFMSWILKFLFWPIYNSSAVPKHSCQRWKSQHFDLISRSISLS